MQPGWRVGIKYLVILLMGPLGVILAKWLGTPWGNRLLVVLLFAPIAIAAWWGGMRAGLLAMVMAIIASFVVFWPDEITTRQQMNFIVTVIIYVIVSPLLSWLITAFRSARQRADLELHDRQHAELKVRDERERLRVTLASIGDAVIVTDVEGRVTFINPVAVALTGWTYDEAVGNPLVKIFKIVHEQTRKVVENPVDRVLREKVVVGLANHTVLIAKNGREIPIDDSGAPIQGADGSIAGVVLVFRDVTETRKAMQARLHLAAIVESSDDAIISKNLDGIITSWNRGAERLYGYTAEEVVGKPISILVPPNHPEELPWLMERLNRGEGVDHFETQRICKDGRRVDVALVISPIRGAGGDVIGASTIARDITASKEADRYKNEFLALLAHELRNPLAPIRNGLEILKLAKNDVATVESTRVMMERQLQQLSRLVDDLLDVSRINRGTIELRKEHVELRDILRTGVETSEPLIQQANHQLTVHLPEEPLLVFGDRTRLSQIVGNLLNNAAKYTEPGGRISLSAKRDADKVVIQVKDNGIGIPPQMLPRVFDLFTQVDRSLEKTRGGLGVGLTIVHRLVEMHGGTIEVHSDVTGKGSEFVIQLPAAAATSATQQATTHDAVARPRTPRRILVVDDNWDAASSLAVMLKMLGHEVETATDGLAALEAAQAFRPDVILMDIGMPTLNGYDACRRIREQSWSKGVLIIAVTGWGQDRDRARSKEAGFDGHLVKPLDHAALRELLAKKPE